MQGVRRGARAVMKWFAPLIFLAIIAQILLAGEGIFGIKKGPKLDDQKTLDPHRALGFILTEPVAILFLIVALLAWHPDVKVRRIPLLLPFLTDRKSTRLNSSHTVISYAVFCLKKKKRLR